MQRPKVFSRARTVPHSTCPGFKSESFSSALIAVNVKTCLVYKRRALREIMSVFASFLLRDLRNQMRPKFASVSTLCAYVSLIFRSWVRVLLVIMIKMTSPKGGKGAQEKLTSPLNNCSISHFVLRLQVFYFRHLTLSLRISLPHTLVISLTVSSCAPASLKTTFNAHESDNPAGSPT